MRFQKIILVLAFMCAALGLPRTAHASGVVGNGTPASCTEAAFVAALTGGGAISFNCGPNPHTITFTTRRTINTSTSIDGAGKMTLSGGGNTGFFDIGASRTLTLTGLTLTKADNASGSLGQAISVGSGVLVVANSTFSQNAKGTIVGLTFNGIVTITHSSFISNSSNGLGAAVYNTGQLFISDSTFIDNAANSGQTGGAIYNNRVANISAQATIIRSTFDRNSAGYGGTISNIGVMTITQSALSNSKLLFNGGGGGGAILNGSGGQLHLENVTISGGTNLGNNSGAALYVDGAQASPGRATLVNVTLADNTGGNSQLHVNNYGVVELKNTLMLNGTCTKTAGFGTLTDNGNNLAFNALNCPGANADPQLGLLQDNGGPTFTRAISATSPARDAGSNTGCPAFDQRGIIRPQNATCDIGAFEYNAVPIFTGVNPTTACVGASSLALTATGSNLIDGPSGTRIKLNGNALPTTFVNNTQLTTIVGAAELASPPHTLTFTLETPVVDGGVSIASHTVQVDVCNQPIQGLTATSNAPSLLGNATQFTATITSGGGVSYIWDFGDGQLGSGANPTHTYPSVGSYVANVTATNNLNRMVADTVVNVNLATTGLLASRFDSDFGVVITYTYAVTYVAPPGSQPISVIISGSVPGNTDIITYTNATYVPTGGDYGKGFVRTTPPITMQPGQVYTITWIVKPFVIFGDIVNQGHASTDDGLLQVFERDRVRRIMIILARKP
jgi:hypothetical protein